MRRGLFLLLAMAACGGGSPSPRGTVERSERRESGEERGPVAPEGGAKRPATVDRDARSVDASSADGGEVAEGSAPSTSGADARGGQTQSWRKDGVDRPRPGAPVSILEAVRVGRHDGFDRVTFQLAGGVPGYHVEYVDAPVRQCGSGEPVEVAGGAWLEVRLQPAAAHTESGAPTIDARDRREDLPIVRHLVMTCDFEADVTWVIGVASPERYRILELADPPRLVVDVAHR